MAQQPKRKSPRGRKRDESRDPEILARTLDVLAESGYEGMTVDMVAARVGAGRNTVYRRWPTKAALIVEAIRSIGPTARPTPAPTMPDTGTLAGDLHALMSPAARAGNGRMMQIIAGVLPHLPDNPELADVVSECMVAPRFAMMRLLFERAQRRGEIAAGRNIDALALVLPSMFAYRTLVTREAIDEAFIAAVIDDVIVPASMAGG